MTRTNILLAAGVLLVGLGILLGAVIGVSTSGTYGEKSCGAPWSGKDPVVGSNFSGRKNVTDYAAECSDARQTRGMVAFVVMGLGVVVIGSAFVLDRRVKSPSGS